MKKLKDMVNEAREGYYHVSLAGVKDSDGLPVNVTIMIDRDNKKEFEKWLEAEEGNTFLHAEGGNVEY